MFAGGAKYLEAAVKCHVVSGSSWLSRAVSPRVLAAAQGGDEKRRERQQTQQQRRHTHGLGGGTETRGYSCVSTFHWASEMTGGCLWTVRLLLLSVWMKVSDTFPFRNVGLSQLEINAVTHGFKGTVY